jgi:hypothetical protein
MNGHTERSSHQAFCMDGFAVRVHLASFERTWQKTYSAFRQRVYGYIFHGIPHIRVTMPAYHRLCATAQNIGVMILLGVLGFFIGVWVKRDPWASK